MTFFAIDVGNTRLKWAQYADAQPGARLLAYGAEFLENIETLAESRWSKLQSPDTVMGCIVAGEGVRRRVQEQLEIWDAVPQWVTSEGECAGLVNGYDYPSRLGVDRWIAMIGARQRAVFVRNLCPLIVVMVGTAVTVDAVDGDGRFLGGLILPGHGIMLKALESGTAGLHVPTGEVQIFPTNTSDALTSGGTYAIAGAVERMIQHLTQHCGKEPMCIMTGGAAWKMAPSMTRTFQLVDHLIFEGLLAVAQERRTRHL